MIYPLRTDVPEDAERWMREITDWVNKTQEYFDHLEVGLKVFRMMQEEKE